MDSLVRIGASQQSPDPHRSRHVSVEAPHPALPQGPQWDSAINPLQSDADAERFVQQLRAEQQRPGGSRPSSRPASRPSSRPGSRRASQDGPRPVAQSMAAVVGREEPRHAPGMRAGSEPPAPAPQAARPADLPQLEVPVFDGGKVPGAGTWVR